MRRSKLAPAFVLTAALLPACGGGQGPDDPTMHQNPPGVEPVVTNPPPPEPDATPDEPTANPPGPDADGDDGDDDADDGGDEDDSDE